MLYGIEAPCRSGLQQTSDALKQFFVSGWFPWEAIAVCRVSGSGLCNASYTTIWVESTNYKLNYIYEIFLCCASFFSWTPWFSFRLMPSITRNDLLSGRTFAPEVMVWIGHGICRRLLVAVPPLSAWSYSWFLSPNFIWASFYFLRHRITTRTLLERILNGIEVYVRVCVCVCIFTAARISLLHH